MNLDTLQDIKAKAQVAGRNVKFRAVVLELVEELLGCWAALHDLSQDAGGKRCQLCDERRAKEERAKGVLEGAGVVHGLMKCFHECIDSNDIVPYYRSIDMYREAEWMLEKARKELIRAHLAAGE